MKLALSSCPSPSWPWQPYLQGTHAGCWWSVWHVHPASCLSFSQGECRADGCGCPPMMGWSELPLLGCYSPISPFSLFFDSPSPIRPTWRMPWPGFLQLAIQEPLHCSVQCQLLWLIASKVAAPLLRKLPVVFLYKNIFISFWKDSTIRLLNWKVER